MVASVGVACGPVYDELMHHRRIGRTSERGGRRDRRPAGGSRGCSSSCS
jgi:hypothetical protein